MTETWMILGESYRLPVRVEWPEGARAVARVELHPDCAWLRCWQVVIAERLAGVGAWREKVDALALDPALALTLPEQEQESRIKSKSD